MHDAVARSAQPLRRPAAPLAEQFLRYLVCAGLAALANFLAGSVLIESFGFRGSLGFPVAVALAYCVGMTVNFLLNRRLTFESDRRGIDQARTFIVVALSGLAVTTALAALGRDALGLVIPPSGVLPAVFGSVAAPETLSRIIAIGLTSIYSFLGHRYLTFGRGIRLPLRRMVSALRTEASLGHHS